MSEKRAGRPPGAPRPKLLRRFRARTIVAAGLVAMLLVVGGAYLVLAGQSSGSPPPVSLSTTSPSPSGTSGGSGSGSAAAGLNGTWSVVAQDSFVGYRVREQLLVLPAPSDAVGRTSSVTGNLKISGRTIESASFSADLTSLTSDKSMRDQRMHTIGLQSDEFPTAAFVLTSPITFASRPSAGQVVKTTATGRFTVHGVTRQVSIPLQAVWQNGEIQIVGSFDIQFADYSITTPTIAGFVTVQDHGTVELKLILNKQ
jgi:polyisoprenoid-binding protein YceI